jgi:hypothetical protein
MLPGLTGVARDFPTTVTANTLFYLPFFVSEPWTPTEFAIRVSTLAAASVAYIWIYAADTDLQPTGAAVLDITSGGALDVSTTGQKAVTGFSTTFQPGWYVAAIRSNGGPILSGHSITAPWNGATTLTTTLLNLLRVGSSATSPPNPGTAWTTVTAGTVLDCGWLFWR